MTDVTRILNAIEGGDARATDELLPLVYEELRLLAAQKLSHEKPGQTLQATALVHEAYLRLVHEDMQNWKNRGHFFVVAAEAMRRILVDRARQKKSLKRGGNRNRISLDQAGIDYSDDQDVERILALEEALTKLSEENAVQANLVKLHYFTGLTMEQAAEALGISPSTARRYWAYARAWLLREMS